MFSFELNRRWICRIWGGLHYSIRLHLSISNIALVDTHTLSFHTLWSLPDWPDSLSMHQQDSEHHCRWSDFYGDEDLSVPNRRTKKKSISLQCDCSFLSLIDWILTLSSIVLHEIENSTLFTPRQDTRQHAADENDYLVHFQCFCQLLCSLVANLIRIQIQSCQCLNRSTSILSMCPV